MDRQKAAVTLRHSGIFCRMKFPDKKNSLILFPAAVLLLIPVILLETHLLRNTGGNISFPLDSSFLNISTAKTLAFYKVWGVSKYTFQPATASLLYPFVLALVFFITGAHLIIPVILNVLMAMFFLYTLQQALDRRQFKPLAQVTILVSATLVTTLPLLVVSGTESVLQLLICFLFIETLATTLQDNKDKLSPRVYQYGMLAVATRYEDILLIALACILLASIHRRREALKLAAIAIAPILVFGVISLIKGSYFLPTPMIMAPYPLYLVILTLAAFLASLLLVRKYHRPYALLLVTIPFLFNNTISLSHFERDSVRIYEQQFPVAAFVHRYYRMGTIGTNDVAALSYFSDGRKVDYTGSTSPDIARSKRENSWNPAMADSLSRKNGVWTAILSDSLFDEGVPSRWFRIASWDIPDTRPGATKTFTFYSVYRWDSVLQRHLHDFQPLLPTDISVRYY
jgi:hypothetical protein